MTSTCRASSNLPIKCRLGRLCFFTYNEWHLGFEFSSSPTLYTLPTYITYYNPYLDSLQMPPANTPGLIEESELQDSLNVYEQRLDKAAENELDARRLLKVTRWRSVAWEFFLSSDKQTVKEIKGEPCLLSQVTDTANTSRLMVATVLEG